MKYIIFHLIFLSCLADISALKSNQPREILENDVQSHALKSNLPREILENDVQSHALKSNLPRGKLENDVQSTGAQRGKTVIQPVGNDGFHCQEILFNSNFSSGSPVRVFISINHENKSSGVHDPAFIWVADVTTSRFTACLVKSGRGSGQNTNIDWLAFQGFQSGVYHGSTSFALFTTEIKCRRVTFPKPFSEVPKVHVTVQHVAPNQKQDAMIIWTESVSTSHFEVCLLESRRFDGPHNNIAVNWMAFEHFSSLLQAKESSEIVIADSEVPTAENNYALCKNVTFATPFFTAPVALITVRNGGSNKAHAVCRKKCPLSSWLEEVTTSYLRVCVRDMAGFSGQRSHVIVDYLVIGDHDPCTNVTCKYHSHCVASSPRQFTCVCEDNCPSYEEQVCASNGRTFKNLCLLQQKICRTRGNYTKYHPGSCTGFPFQKGRQQFPNTPSWAEDQCEIIKFEPYTFYPHKKIYIQLTVNHHNYSDATFVHEATTPWVESVNSTQFTACVTRAGRNDYPSDSFATIDWVAYQGAPSGGVVGEEMFSRWWTGTSCRLVTLPNGKYSSSPTIFATADHHRSRLKHDAASVWLEDVSASSFKICLRELQNFAGAHDDISVNWLAFESLHRPLFSEHNEVNFQNNALPSEKHNFAFCQNVSFIRSYNTPPTVLLTTKHSTRGGNAAAECNGIVSWIEFVTKSEFRICAKELFVQRFDPLAASYAVLSDVCQDDWNYFNGYCYRKVSSCDSWSGSQGTCATFGTNLPSVYSQEENVYIQSLHGGEHSWLGLSDIKTEGTFVWSDGTPFDFHFWAKHQPNNFHNEDCVHTLGFLQGHKYEWNDVNCTDCHRFTCKKDYNECNDFSHACPVNATCVNSDGSFSCQCPVGYRLDGNNCTDVNECLGSFSCHPKAQCLNVPGSYKCRCLPGYVGDGKTTCKMICTTIKTVGSPVTHHSRQTTYGAWMKDPLAVMGNDTIFVMESYYGNNAVDEFKNLEKFKAGVVRKRYTLPYQWDGTGGVVYGSYLYYNRANTQYIVKYNLLTESLEAQITLNGYRPRQVYYAWSGYSGVDLAVDEQGLWVLWGNIGDNRRLYASKIDNDVITHTYSLATEQMNSMGNAFVACGVIYCIDTCYTNPTTINFAYDTKTGKQWNPNIQFTNKYGYNSMVDYNPRERVLYAWDNKRQVTYSLTWN
ncbi:uncharacterized protein LOC144664627 isoform X3 [Oculina patagonica]